MARDYKPVAGDRVVCECIHGVFEVTGKSSMYDWEGWAEEPREVWQIRQVGTGFLYEAAADILALAGPKE